MSLNIPNNVHTIEIYAFWNTINLNTVTFLSSLKHIGNYSFELSGITAAELSSVEMISKYAYFDCHKLTAVTLPDTLKELNLGVFMNCISLIWLNIPKHVNRIPYYLCYNCSKMNSLEVTSEIYYIYDYAFMFCSSLESIAFSSNLKFLGKWAFSNCSKLADISINLTYIEVIYDRTFCETAIYEVYLPQAVTRLCSTFNDCRKSYKVILPSSLIHIEESCFRNCNNLNEVVWPESLSYIGPSALENCNLRGMLNLSLINLTQIGDYAFHNNRELSYMILPHGLVSIGDFSFSFCTSLKMFVAPSTVQILRISTFSDCYNL